MKRFYVVFAVILAFSILLGGCADGTKSGENEYVDQSPSQSSAYWSDGSEFTPVLRFVAASDTHVFPSYTVNAETRLKNLFVDAYAYAETQDYKTVDAVILNGDLCESGREVEYTHLMETISENVRQNETVVLPLFAGHECIEKQVNQGATDEELTEYIASYTGIDPGVHLKLNGYHIIGLSNAYDHLIEGYDKAWMAEQMQTASADDPEKPIFVFSHHPFMNTVLGTGEEDIDLPNWPLFGNVLDNYPQTVYFSAHLHTAIQHPLSIVQDKFTCIDCGAVNYLSNISQHKEYYENNRVPHGVAGANMQIVEVDAQGRIRLLPYDLNVRKFMNDPGMPERQLIRYIEDAGDPSTWLYTETRAEDADRPYFPNAGIKIEEALETSVKISFEQAKDKEGVEGYLIRVKEKESGNILAEKNLTSMYYLDPMPTVRTTVIEGIDLTTSKDYVVEIVAKDFYGKESAPIKKEFYLNTAPGK